jgi:hypothetical protein
MSGVMTVGEGRPPIPVGGWGRCKDRRASGSLQEERANIARPRDEAH